MKKFSVILILTTVLIAATAATTAVGQGFPVRYWTDDMPRHTFSLGIGPSWITGQNPLAEREDFDTHGASPIGINLALRYDWSYFRGYEVAMGTGLTSMFIYGSRPFRDQTTYAWDGKLSESIGYLGLNAVNTKMWFGKRFIGDVSIHMGYLWGASTVKRDRSDDKTKVRQNGFAGGVSVGMDCLITAWMGIGVHCNLLAGTPDFGGSQRNFTECAVRVGAVYCF